jgi:hypothetical protein
MSFVEQKGSQERAPKIHTELDEYSYAPYFFEVHFNIITLKGRMYRTEKEVKEATTMALKKLTVKGPQDCFL